MTYNPRGTQALLLSHSAAMGGASRSLLSIVEALVGAEVGVVVFSPDGPMQDAYRSLGARVEPWNPPALYWAGRAVYSSGDVSIRPGYVLALCRHPFVLRQAIRRIRAELETGAISVIHVNSLVLFPLARWLGRLSREYGVRVVWHVREIVGTRLPSWARDRITGAIAHSSYRVLAISDSVAVGFGRKENLVVLFNDPGAAWLARAQGTERRQGHTVVMTAPFLPGKGIEAFLGLARTLTAEFPALTFRLYTTVPAVLGGVDRALMSLVGRASRTAQLVLRCLWRPRTCVLDERVEVIFGEMVMPHHYEECCVFVNPDAAGVTWGRTIIEAMCAGLPVVATGTDSGFVVEGETGYVVPPERHDLLIERVRILVADPQLSARMGEAAAARATEMFAGFAGRILQELGFDSHGQKEQRGTCTS